MYFGAPFNPRGGDIQNLTGLGPQQADVTLKFFGQVGGSHTNLYHRMTLQCCLTVHKYYSHTQQM